jgi:nicotinamidase-related amidase
LDLCTSGGKVYRSIQLTCGETLKPLDRNSALIVVDMQNGFDDSIWGARNNPTAEECVAALLQAWRGVLAPVIHVHHYSTSPTGLFRPGTPGSEPKSKAVPLDGEALYHKRVNCAFVGTTLEADLRQWEIESLVVVGLTTNHCVSTTVRMAGNLGFTTYVVADATATFDRAGADGRLRRAKDVHNAALGDLHEEFAEVVDTKTAISALTLQGGESLRRPRPSANDRLRKPPP